MRAVFAFVPLVLIGAYTLHVRTSGTERAPIDRAAPIPSAARPADSGSEAIRIQGSATATIVISLDGSLDALRREFESWDGESERGLEHLSLSGDLFADLAASLDAYLAIETDDGRRVLVAELGRGDPALR